MRTRHGAILISSFVAAIAVLFARPAIASAWRRSRTASAPSVGIYDAIASRFLAGYYDAIAADCIGAVAGTQRPAILEIGPGPGHLAERLLSMSPDVRWTGLDVDPEMLAATSQRLERRRLSVRASLVEGDVSALPFEDGAFDLVVSSFSAHHWPDAVAGFREIQRVLRPGAAALVYDLPPAWGRIEMRSPGIDAAAEAFPPTAIRRQRFRGLGPVTLVIRVELRRLPDLEG